MKRRSWIPGAILALQPMLAQAGVYVLIDGVPGSSTTAPYQGWHHAKSVSWSVDRSNTGQPFKFTLVMEQNNASMATIKQAAFSGAILRKLTVDSTVTMGPASPKPLARLTCDGANIGKFAFSGQANDMPTTQLDLNCARLLWEDFEYNLMSGAFVKSLKGEITFLSKTP